MLLPLYSYWRYRKIYAEDQDEYVSRIRDGSQASISRKFVFEDVANGLPLETIYGKDHVHYTTAVGTGRTKAHGESKKSRSKSISGSVKERGMRDPFADTSEAESSQRMPGITIETKWMITEETMANPYKRI